MAEQRGRRGFIGSIAALLAAGGGSAFAADDRYPSRMIRIIVPSPPGSGTDNAVRPVARYLAETRGWSLIVDNKPGGNGFIAVRDLLRAPADGYTLFGASSSTITANPVLFKNLPYDPSSDFVPVARSIVVPFALIPAPRLGVTTVAELTRYLKAKDRNFSYATSGANRPVAERYLQAIGVSGTNVPYKANPPAITDLIGGQVDFMFVDTGLSMALVTSGQLKALAFSSKARMKALPQIPTMEESGFPGFEMSAWAGFFAPKGTPVEVAELLHRSITPFYATPAGERSVELAGGYFEDLSRADFHAWIDREIAVNREVYRRAGIEPE